MKGLCMERDVILDHLRAYFTARLPPEMLDSFENIKPRDIISNSMEAVDLVLFMEEKTGVELGLAEIGPAVASMTFGALADEIQRMVTASRA